jgi:hypothetical protein
MPAVLWAIVTWLLREVVIKFLIFSGLLLLISFLVPLAVEYLGSLIQTESLTSFFTNLPPGVWFFLDYFQIPFGFPIIISAYVSRFLIRRLPVIG